MVLDKEAMRTRTIFIAEAVAVIIAIIAAIIGCTIGFATPALEGGGSPMWNCSAIEGVEPNGVQQECTPLATTSGPGSSTTSSSTTTTTTTTAPWVTGSSDSQSTDSTDSNLTP